jgi:hypothetical protein
MIKLCLILIGHLRFQFSCLSPGSFAWITTIGLGSHVTVHCFLFGPSKFVFFFGLNIVFQTQIGKFDNVEFEGGC